MITKLFNRKSTTQTKNDISDELVGKWINWAGDDCGMAIMWWNGLEFKEGGTGINHHCSSHVPIDEQQVPFVWARISDRKIKIKYAKDLEWEEVEYEISTHQGEHDVAYLKLIEVGKEGFWECSGPIYQNL